MPCPAFLVGPTCVTAERPVPPAERFAARAAAAAYREMTGFDRVMVYRFLPDDSGAFGPLASNAWWSVFRARERGAAGGLAWRWGFWVVMAVALSAIAGWIVVMAVRLVRLGWS